MSFTTRVRVEGLEPMLSALGNVKASLRNRYLRAGIRKAGAIVRKAARAKLRGHRKAAVAAQGIVAVNEKGKKIQASRAFTNEILDLTGALDESLAVKIVVNDRKKRVSAVVGPEYGHEKQVGTRTRDGKKSKAGDPIMHDPAKIAHLVEYGHGGPRPAPPHPFMRPAYDETKNAAQAAIADELAKGLAKAAQK